MYKTFLKTFHKPLALKISQNFYKHRSLGSTVLFKITTGAWAQLFVLKYKREPVLNRLLLNLYGSLGDRAPMVDFSKLMIMLINHQPLEAYTFLLYPSEHGSLCIDRAIGRTCVRITFSGKYGGIDLMSSSP